MTKYGEIERNSNCNFIRGRSSSKSNERLYYPQKISMRVSNPPSSLPYPFSCIGLVEVRIIHNYMEKMFQLTGVLIGPSQMLVQFDSDKIWCSDIRVFFNGEVLSVCNIFRNQNIALNRLCILLLSKECGLNKGYLGMLANKRTFDTRYFNSFDLIADSSPK